MKSYIVILFAILGIAYAGDSIWCPNNNVSTMNDEMRQKILEKHNEYRYSLVFGLVKMKKGYARRASRMRQLEYDCKAELSAYYSALHSCDSSPYSMDEYDENRYVMEHKGDITKAADSWWSEIRGVVLDQKDRKNDYSSKHKIPNFANMVWDTREKLGCAVAKCRTGKTHVVCHYAPKLREEGKRMYWMGPPCARCSDYGDEFECFERKGFCVKNFASV
ncbi:SCP-like protein [Ancylostoma caninum]|uniref:SCP-like protein n=1 Tax=Ancylostoma caninum TaxID=29170 RepID=A0A368H4F4_ANCCA|nr:SCP-like protein [Ancylostoma caninum]